MGRRCISVQGFSVLKLRAVIVAGNVRHSQSVSSAPLRPWVAAEADGRIVCAHCTCMAVLGEACSHIAALLFWLEDNNRLLADPSCTSVPCQWSAPTMQNADYRRIKDIDFASPEFKMNHGAKKKELQTSVYHSRTNF